MVDLFVSSLEKPRPVHFRVDGPSLKASRFHVIQSADLHISEAKKGETRTNFPADTVRDIGEFRFCVTVVFVIEIPVLQNLPKFQRHGGPLGDRLCADHMSGKILTKIKHGLPGRCVNDLLHTKRLHVMQRTGIPVTELSGSGNQNRPFPGSGRFGVVLCFAVINIRERGKTAPVLPGWI